MSRSKNCCCVPMDGMFNSQICCMPTQGQQMYQVSPVQLVPANYNPGYQGNQGNSWIWILLLLCFCGNNGNGSICGNGCNNGCNNGCGCGNNNSWLWIIILLCCCGGGNNGFGGFGC